MLRSQEKWLFAFVGVSVAVFGRILLDLLIAVGLAAALANVVQAIVTLQVNFAGNRLLTWRRVAGSGVALW